MKPPVATKHQRHSTYPKLGSKLVSSKHHALCKPPLGPVTPKSLWCHQGRVKRTFYRGTLKPRAAKHCDQSHITSNQNGTVLNCVPTNKAPSYQAWTRHQAWCEAFYIHDLI